MAENRLEEYRTLPPFKEENNGNLPKLKSILVAPLLHFYGLQSSIIFMLQGEWYVILYQW